MEKESFNDKAGGDAGNEHNRSHIVIAPGELDAAIHIQGKAAEDEQNDDDVANGKGIVHFCGEVLVKRILGNRHDGAGGIFADADSVAHNIDDRNENDNRGDNDTETHAG